MAKNWAKAGSTRRDRRRDSFFPGGVGMRGALSSPAGRARVELFPGGGGEPGSHCFPAGRDGGGFSGASGLGGFGADRDQEQEVVQGGEIGGGSVAAVSEPGAGLLFQPGG